MSNPITLQQYGAKLGQSYGSAAGTQPKSRTKTSSGLMNPLSQSGAQVMASSGVGAAIGSPVLRTATIPGQRPLRMVHVGPCFTRGGAEQHIIDLARFLDPQRLTLDKCIVTQAQLVDPTVVASMPAPVECGGLEEVRRASQEHDVLLFWGLAIDEWLGDCRAPLTIFLAHGDGDWTSDQLLGSTLVTDHVIAVSRGVQRLVCNGFPSTVILNGIDSSRLSQTRSREDMRSALGFQPDDFVLGYLGRFSPEKRPERLIEAVARLPRQFKALVVGWGPMQGDLYAMANALIPGRFAFACATCHLGDYYHAMDALCLLSEYEGFALVALEAMMCQRPLIATPVGSVPEIIKDRVNGIVVNDDVQSVCEAAELLHRHPHWARGIAAEGKAFAEQHGHAWRMAREYEDLVERLWTEKNVA